MHTAAKTVLALMLGFLLSVSNGLPSELISLGPLQITGAFTRVMPPRAPTGGGFVTITNTGNVDDRLIEVISPVADVVELHIMEMVAGVMKMSSSPQGFEIPAGEVTILGPGGKHIMFMKVHDPFTQGEPVPVTLVFEKAGSIEIMLPVAPIGAKSFVGN